MVDVDEMRKSFLVPEIKPLDHYDFHRAKIAGSLSWLLGRSYGPENVPEELREPFYTDQYEQEHIKPPVIGLLLSSDIYCRVCGQTLARGEQAPPADNAAVLQALSRRGIQVKDQEVPVTEDDLRHKPIKMVFGVWEETEELGENPRRSQGECTNPVQTAPVVRIEPGSPALHSL